MIMKKLKLVVIVVVITVIVLIALLYWIGSKEEKKSSLSNNANLTNSSTNTSTKFPNTFKDDNLGLSVAYPADWEYTQTNASTVVFSGKANTEAYYSTVNVQSITSKKAGGKYATTEEVMNSLKTQFLTAPQAKVIEEGTTTLTQVDGTEYSGKYLIVTYLYENQPTKEEQKVFARKDGLGFYAWAYTSPADQYDKYFPIAKSMLEQIHLAK